ncbi:hypothetical protein OHT76_03560 [Streptomyces sp. NBC_00287]|uniref:hypothetical protein n=1 Tax=Streptomyces sp. NBC_00287 TaxID=2975702 RepID=UPI002E2E3ED0|nr:hypothetical protein [Streptomyces sp. NBC_00287]
MSAGLTYALALASCTLAHLVGDVLLEDGEYAQGEPWPALFGIAAPFAVAALLGLTLGTLVHLTPVAVARPGRWGRRSPPGSHGAVSAPSPLPGPPP